MNRLEDLLVRARKNDWLAVPWSYSVTHQLFTVRLEERGASVATDLVLTDCRTVRFSSAWFPANFEMQETDSLQKLVQVEHGFEIVFAGTTIINELEL